MDIAFELKSSYFHFISYHESYSIATVLAMH